MSQSRAVQAHRSREHRMGTQEEARTKFRLQGHTSRDSRRPLPTPRCFLGRPPDSKSIEGLIHSLGERALAVRFLSFIPSQTHPVTASLVSWVALNSIKLMRSARISHSNVCSRLSETRILVTSPQGTPPSTLKVESLKCGGRTGHRFEDPVGTMFWRPRGAGGRGILIYSVIMG